MASSSNLINLDSLIKDDFDDDAVVLKISEENVAQQSNHEYDSGSDSSYTEFAQNTARRMDAMIAEAEFLKVEKTKRIAAARLQKVKEQEEKQKSFGGRGSVKKMQNKKMNKTACAKQNKNVPSDKCKNYLEGIIESDRQQKENPVDKTDVPTKLRNVTIQNFDIESPESDEESSLNFEKYNQILLNYEKSFTVKNLNRTEANIEVTSSNDSDDENSQPIKQNHFHSAEKSAANHRRKRSNFLKKRYSNFKQEKNPNEPSQNQTDGNNPENLSNSNPLTDDKLLKSDFKKPNFKQDWRRKPRKEGGVKNNIEKTANRNKNNDETLENRNKVTTKAQNNSDIKSPCTSKGVNLSTDKSNDKGKKKSKTRLGSHKPINETVDKSIEKNSKEIAKPKNQTNKDSFAKKNFHDPCMSNSFKATHIDDTLQSDVIKKYKRKQAVKRKGINEQRIFTKDGKYLNENNSSDDSVIVLEETPFNQVKKNDQSGEHGQETILNFERSSLSSENEIDWKAVEESQQRKSEIKLSQSISKEVNSDDNEEIDFYEIVANHKSRTPASTLHNSVVSEKPAIDQQLESSSDFDEEFEACLLKFDNMNKNC